MRHAFLAASILLATATAAASEPKQRSLTFAERVKAQEAIERVYYSHQTGRTKSFEQAVPRSVLENKVRKYLDETAALQVYWKTSVTDEMLQREMERMANGTRMPERLLDLYAALGSDSFLIKECLARATLVDRLSHSFYAFDPTLHADARRRAEELHRQLSTRELSPAADHPSRSVVELVMSESAADLKGTNPFRHQLSQDEFRAQRAQLPRVVGQVSAIEEKRDAFAFSVVLSETTREMRVANYLITKTTWDAWWANSATATRVEQALPVASSGEPLPRVAVPGSMGAAQACALDDTWDDGRGDAPETRSLHTAVWTGSVMIVWGGRDSALSLNTGARYDPATDSWAPISTVAAPSARFSHTAVWSGTVMIVWGGNAHPDDLGTGAKYDPVTNSWTPTSSRGAPSGRHGHTAVWTGSAMVVWGGATDAPPYFLGTGGLYDPTRNVWSPTETIGAPSPRFAHTSVWTGSEMVVWGGADDGGYCLTGGRYDPGTDTWTDTTTNGAPSARSAHTAVWTQNQVLIWGGDDTGGITNTGGRYDPASNSWTATSTLAAPAGRSEHTAIWTGTQMVVWGGVELDGFTATGGRYDPATDSWTPTFTTSGPSGREFATAVWTGSLLVVWGGYDGATLDTGGRYDPATDSWTTTLTTGAPSARAFHTAVWTGSLMVVWGGAGSNVDFLDTGGSYDPATDIWTPVSTTGAPSARDAHTAVWTGGLMVVWGGRATDLLGTGGRYDPATDTWTPVSTTGAPSARGAHTAVWTGGLMVVWGGFASDGTSDLILDTGGRYDPTTDSWTPTSMTGVPAARYFHTSVWTDSSMVVWGGAVSGDPFALDTLGRYDPATDSWVTTPRTGAPAARYGHTAVWTGSQMVIWGGNGLDGYLNTGGRYDPATNLWTSTSTTGAPSGRWSHSAVWTGTEMIVWGGLGYASAENTGGRYCIASCASPATWYLDADGDGYGATSAGVPSCLQPIGYVAVSGDCDDANLAIHPGAAEICNGIADSCDGVIDKGGNALCHDASGCTTADICGGLMGCMNKSSNLDLAGFSATRVDGRDLVVLADAWNSCPGDPRYKATANLDGVPTLPDACVDMTDFHLFMTTFGRDCP